MGGERSGLLKRQAGAAATDAIDTSVPTGLSESFTANPFAKLSIFFTQNPANCREVDDNRLKILLDRKASGYFNYVSGAESNRLLRGRRRGN
jgi:hypothetical protein